MGRVASNGWIGLQGEARPPQAGPARKGLNWITGTVATVTAVLLASVLTVVFAATLAVMVVLTGALIGVYALAQRARPRQQGVLIEARRVGHSWVAYGWDQRRR